MSGLGFAIDIATWKGHRTGHEPCNAIVLHNAIQVNALSADKPPEAVACLGPGEAVCHERLGGLLKHYQRRAA
jgi:hypothetical protein